jgi:hypothetical protein
MKKLYLLFLIAGSLASCHKEDTGAFVTMNKTFSNITVYSNPPTVYTSSVTISSETRKADSAIATVSGSIVNNFTPNGTEGNVTLTLIDSKGLQTTVPVYLQYNIQYGTAIPFTYNIPAANVGANIESVAGVLWTN